MPRYLPPDTWTALSGSELTSALLALFHHRAAQLKPAQVLQAFKHNRFVRPSPVSPLLLKTMELEALKIANQTGFIPVELSPVAPLATCAAVAPVHQHNVLSASRACEVVADATNVLALLIAAEWQKRPAPPILKYVCTHRHVRTQAYHDPAYSAHFSVLALATGGLVHGNHQFEILALTDHISMHYQLLTRFFPDHQIGLTVWVRQAPDLLVSQLRQELDTRFPHLTQEWVRPAPDHSYYPIIQFKLNINRDGQTFDMADGGVVDWTQKLLNNRKHRLVISGLGLEMAAKFYHLPLAE